MISCCLSSLVFILIMLYPLILYAHVLSQAYENMLSSKFWVLFVQQCGVHDFMLFIMLSFYLDNVISTELYAHVFSQAYQNMLSSIFKCVKCAL